MTDDSRLMYKTLVDTHTLAKHLDDPSWVVVDCRFTLTDPQAGRRAYAAGHIPGARYAHLDEDLSSPIVPASGRHPLPDPKVLADRLGRWGIDNAKQVVVYDDSFGAMAARLWWLLRWLGHEACALLDGGSPSGGAKGFRSSPTGPRARPRRSCPRSIMRFGSTRPSSSARSSRAIMCSWMRAPRSVFAARSSRSIRSPAISPTRSTCPMRITLI